MILVPPLLLNDQIHPLLHFTLEFIQQFIQIYVRGQIATITYSNL